MTSTMSFSRGQAPAALPLLGHAHKFARTPLDFMASLRAYGDLVEIRIGPRKAYVLCHPLLAWEVFRDPVTFDKGGFLFDKARKYFGNGLASSAIADHQRHRPLVQPAFSKPRLASYTAVMHEEATALTASWHSGTVIEVKSTMDVFMTRVVARTLISTEPSSAAITEIQQAMPIIMEALFRRMADPTGLWEKLPTPGNRRVDAAANRIRTVVDDTIRRYRGQDSDHGDMLSMLLAARDEQSGAGLTNEEIHDQIMTIMSASGETTAATMAWTLHLLAEHPDVEARMHAEIDEVLGGRLPDFAEIPKLEYTRRVITEAQRMYPSGWLFTRTTTADTELGGHPIRAGSTVVFCPYQLFRDPAVFAEPERFDPDRWLPERVTALQRQSWIPFGAGVRKCIGDVFGLTQATIALASITARWRLRHVPGCRTRAVTKAILVPEPLSMVMTSRSAR